MSTQRYSKVPPDHASEREHRRLLAEAANRLMDGKLNTTSTVTLTANAATTVVANIYVGVNSAILLSPTTLNAARAATVTYVSSKGKQTFTITHPVDATTDRTFDYAVIG